MRGLRTKAVGIMFFSLISLGQAYPFSSVWASYYKEVHSCCCDHGKFKCRCDHTLGKSCRENAGPGWKVAPCGSRQQDEARLDFRGDPFLPVNKVVSAASVSSERLQDPVPPKHRIFHFPESPPPRS